MIAVRFALVNSIICKIKRFLKTNIQIQYTLKVKVIVRFMGMFQFKPVLVYIFKLVKAMPDLLLN